MIDLCGYPAVKELFRVRWISQALQVSQLLAEEPKDFFKILSAAFLAKQITARNARAFAVLRELVNVLNVHTCGFKIQHK